MLALHCLLCVTVAASIVIMDPVNLFRGALAVVVVFIVIGVIHMPDGPFIRPHPGKHTSALCQYTIPHVSNSTERSKT